MKTNIIPQSYAGVTDLALLALAGLQAHGAFIGIEHNTAPVMQGAIHLLTGNPATPAIPGKQALLNAQLLTIKTTTAAALAAAKDARAFCMQGLGLLKPSLGQRSNGNWIAAGFTGGSLAVPPVPLTMLLQFRSFFEVNPARESGAISAVGAQAKATALQAAIQARDTAKGLRFSVKAARDEAFAALRKRLSGLRAELAQLIAPTDDRWYAFGFRRPADGKVPKPVSALLLTPLGAGTVLAQWPASSYAESYRVTWKPSSASSGEPGTQAGLVSATQFALTGLPSGVSIIVSVSARNGSGETEPVEAAIVVP
jgi:hypothetical protein